MDTNAKDSGIADRLKSHVETVAPGLPQHLGGKNAIGDKVAQGDLYLMVTDEDAPIGYLLVKKPSDDDRQLVPLGGGPGSHHRLRSLEGVDLYRPIDWGKRDTDLRGPYLVFHKDNAIVHEPGHSHPHGTVTVGAGTKILCGYQKNLDAITREERRAAD